MCKALCETIAELNTPKGKFEVFAIAEERAGGLGFHYGRLGISWPGESIHVEFTEFLSPQTWVNAWDRLRRQIEAPWFRGKLLFKEPDVVRLLEKAKQKLASLPVQ